MNINSGIILSVLLAGYYTTKGLNRYILIMVSIILALTYFLKQKKDIKKELKNVDYKFLGLFLLPIMYYLGHSLIVGILLNKLNFNIVYIKEFLYVFIPIMLIFIIDISFKEKDQIIKYIYISVVAAFIIQSVILNMDYIISNIGNKNRPFGLFENHILTQALVYFLLYQLYNKDYKKAVISTVLILIGNKRVVYIAIIISLIPFIIVNIKKITNKTKAILVSIYLIMAQIVNVISIKLGVLQSVMSMLHIDDKWRSAIWGSFLPEINISLGFMGNGVGYVIEKLKIIGNVWYPYLYNEPLKYYIEIGFIGFLIFSIIKLVPMFLNIHLEDKYFKFIVLSFSFFTSVVFFDNLNYYQEYIFIFISIIYFSYQECKIKINIDK